MSNILIGVTGGIAAYKVADLIGALYGCGGNQIKVVMTENAKKFITTLTLATLAKGPVFDDASEWASDGIIKHIELAKWSDIFVIVPATAHTIAKISTGIADNLLTSIYLALHGDKVYSKKIIICPAMNTHMFDKKQTQQHLDVLSSRSDHLIVQPVEGLLACGDYGIGKLPPTRALVEKILTETKT